MRCPLIHLVTPLYDKLAIPQRAVELLVEEHAKHPHSPYLFVSPKTGTMFDPGSFRHTHEKILKAIGAEHIRFHDLRHTFATLSLKYGVDVKTLSGALGHYDAGFTLSTYTHATEGMKRSAADTIGSVISQAMQPQKIVGRGADDAIRSTPVISAFGSAFGSNEKRKKTRLYFEPYMQKSS